MKTIELTDEQYKILVKLSFIGEWVLNAQHVIPPFKEESECLNYIFSNCEKYNLRDLFNNFGHLWEMKDETVLGILPEIKRFSANDFWASLISNLSERDITEKANNSEQKLIDDDEFEILFEKRSEEYKNEFEQNGLDNLRLMNSENN